MRGFIAEIMIFIGAFPVYTTITIISALGIVITAGYILWTLQRVFLGKLNPKYENISEINGREIFTMAPLAIMIIFLGVYPIPVLNLMKTSLNYLITLIP